MSLLYALAVYLPIMIVLLMLVFIFNGTETSITSLNVLQIKTIISANQKHSKRAIRRFKKIHLLVKQFNETLTMVLCACTLCNTALVTISTLFFTILVQSEGEAI